MSRSTSKTSGANGLIIVPQLDKIQMMRLNNAVQRASKEAQAELRSQLREAGQLFRTEVDKAVPVRSGKLKRGTRVDTDIRNNQFAVTIRNKTLSKPSKRYPRGYRYGKRLEFDPDYGGKFAFWYPTWEEVSPRVRRMFNTVLEKAYQAFVKG